MARNPKVRNLEIPSGGYNPHPTGTDCFSFRFSLALGLHEEGLQKQRDALKKRPEFGAKHVIAGSSPPHRAVVVARWTVRTSRSHRAEERSPSRAGEPARPVCFHQRRQGVKERPISDRFGRTRNNMYKKAQEAKSQKPASISLSEWSRAAIK